MVSANLKEWPEQWSLFLREIILLLISAKAQLYLSFHGPHAKAWG